MANLPTLDSFIDQLIVEKFADQALDDAVKADIKRELTDRLNQYLTLRTIETVSTVKPDAIKELATLVQTNPSAEQVQAFVSAHIENPDVLVAHILADFRALYIGVKEEKPTTN